MEDDLIHVACPYCGESVAIWVEPDVFGSFVQDCEVCCNPWLVRVSWQDGQKVVTVTRDDGAA